MSQILDRIALGDRVEVEIEVPAWSFVKPRADGSLDFVSPLPCPWAYGSLPGVPGGDGDPQDALVLDSAARRGQRVASIVQGVVRFRDAGAVDDKLVCAGRAPGPATRAAIVGFFRIYANAKRLLNLVRRRPGTTAVLGCTWA